MQKRADVTKKGVSQEFSSADFWEVAIEVFLDGSV